MKMKWKKGLSLLLSLAMGLSAVGGLAEGADAAEAVVAAVEEAAAEAVKAAAELPAVQAAREMFGAEAKIAVRHGQITFIEGSCAQEPIASMEEAAAVAAQVSALLGDGTEALQFIPWRTLTDTAGNHYYTFQQMAGGVTVCGGALKVITDSADQMIALSCSVISGLPAGEDAGISAEEAERIALAHAAENGGSLVEGKTEKMILSLLTYLNGDQDVEDMSRYVWVVYTSNPKANVASGSDLPYHAHYIALDGEYLYSLPTVIPGDAAGSTGFDSAYVFEFMEPAEYTGYVDMADGSEREITVTLMRDRRTGMYYLGNIERRIVVADCWPFLYHRGGVQLESSRDNLEWDQVALKSLYNYCKVYDYYKEIGWTGANGEGLPILILNNFCDENGAAVDNAAFVGNYLGWSIFLSSQANDYSECLDVIAHEYTHCVTDAVMTYNAYANDYGAINEAVSDIQGQLCELMMDPTPDDEWLLAEDSGQAIRSLSEPLKGSQPEYTWDLYYQANVAIPTDLNDQGGVHTNSSLLNRIAWLLCNEGGMALSEARAYWFAVDCTMVPGTDYPQLRDLLPWVLKAQGLEGYQAALEAAMEAVRLGDESLPENLAEDRAMITLSLPENEVFSDGNWALQIFSVDVSGILGEAISVLTQVELGDTEGMPALLTMILNGEQNAEANEEETLDIMTEAKDWVLSALRPYLYSGTGAAGQDGHTIRIVGKNGYAIPMLMHMAINGDSQIAEQVTYAVYFNGQWFDVSDIMNAGTVAAEEAEETGETEETDEAEGFSFTALLEDERLQTLVGDVLEKIFSGEGLTSLVFQAKGGEISEISAAGLENIKLSDASFSVTEDGEEVREPRMSRPKVAEETPAE